jgi:glycosyltransferase involved in cell wall biosynthesis
LVQQLQITHLLLEHPYFGWLGLLVQWATGVKLVVHSHNIENTRWKSVGKWWWKILFRYEGAVHRAADYNFFINEADRQYALEQFRLDAKKCTVITYGIEWNSAPGPTERRLCKEKLLQQFNLAPDTHLLLFNGTLGYAPNLQALTVILEKINPLLLSSSLSYKIIICGSGLPENMQRLKAFADKNIIYAGFVEDITVYFKAADLFLNPVIEGGGIKTKLVEAIGYGTATVSTVNGSIGVTKEDAGELLYIVEDGNWQAFATEVIRACGVLPTPPPPAFFEKFYWVNIAKKAAAFMQT